MIHTATGTMGGVKFCALAVDKSGNGKLFGDTIGGQRYRLIEAGPTAFPSIVDHPPPTS